MSGRDVVLRGNVAHLPGPPPLRVALRRSGRARRLWLRVSGVDGQATLTLPANLPMDAALDFLHAREDWLRAAVANAPAPQLVAPGGNLLLRGQVYPIRTGTGRRVQIADGVLVVPPDHEGTRTGARLEAFVKASARASLLAAVARYCDRLGRQARAVTLRDTRSRWGSCTQDGRLMFSWRLVMAPPAVLDYVAAHEVAHLAHMDHSRAFWDCVARLMPDHAPHRRWLRENSALLHSFRFRAADPGG